MGILMILICYERVFMILLKSVELIEKGVIL